jgi:hypothetical protein
MLTILSQAQPATSAGTPFPEQVESASIESHIEESVSTEGESEWVVGPPQMAALAFLGIAGIALFSGFSYLVGKAVGTQLGALPPIELKLPQPTPPELSIGDQFASYAAVTTPAKTTEEPVFADPTPGKSYIQMAAVEKGVAAVFAEGLRTHGLTAFVAPGPDSRIFRVLIGPVTDTPSYTAAKQELDKIGLSTFMRQYQK